MEKIDWFYVVIGIVLLLLAGLFYNKRSNYIAVIDIALAIMSFLKAYYQDKMSVLYWIRRKK
ncbi:MAG: hypothetical protein AABY22_35850 [Nanoarchaeota archaeon]